MARTRPGITLGCDYNPEQWPEAVWAEDVRLMAEAGVGMVSINVFGWAEVNPGKGEWDFSRLDRVMDLLGGARVDADLGTATASTPAWLTRLHPEILPMAADGTRRYPGGRQAWCPSSPVYRRYAVELVDRIASRYRSHPALRLWHVSNELGCHNALCYCPESAAAFRQWLRRRYLTVQSLNRAWGTSFWSQRYSDWDEILPPMATLSTRNPGQMLDFHRFSSEQLLDQYRAEADAIRRHSGAPVTTNFMVTAHIRDMDYWRWAPEVDVVANDHYIDHRLPDPAAELSFAADATRGLAGGAPWMLMETSVGAVNWQPHNLAKRPGQMIRNALTHVARGADAVCFFQWRASLQGAEKFHSAMLPHAGTDSRAWRETLELGQALDRLAEVAGSRVVADAAVVFGWEPWWAADDEDRPTHAMGYLDQVHAAYNALRAAGVTADIVRPGARLSGYRLVVVPGLYLMRLADAEALQDFVDQGGTAMVTFFSGIVDEDDRVVPGGYPGFLRDMLGIRVEEFAPALPDAQIALDSGASARLWSERVKAESAETLDTFSDGPASGGPALTRNRHGHGTAWYLATLPDPASYASLMRRIVDAAGATGIPGSGRELEMVRRQGESGSYLFAINHGRTDAELDIAGFELLDQRPVATLQVPAGAVRVLRETA